MIRTLCWSFFSIQPHLSSTIFWRKISFITAATGKVMFLPNEAVGRRLFARTPRSPNVSVSVCLSVCLSVTLATTVQKTLGLLKDFQRTLDFGLKGLQIY